MEGGERDVGGEGDREMVGQFRAMVKGQEDCIWKGCLGRLVWFWFAWLVDNGPGCWSSALPQ